MSALLALHEHVRWLCHLRRTATLRRIASAVLAAFQDSGGATVRRLNYRLNQACTEDLGRLCSDLCNVTSHRSPCGGMALRCLQDKQEEVWPP